MSSFHASNPARNFCEIVVFLFMLTPAMFSHTWNDSTNSLQTIKATTKLPAFDEITYAIDAEIGETVLLPCTVRNLGDKVVSWIRKRDLHILTSGVYTFSADNRFAAVYSSKTDFWGLRIRGAKVSDNGRYECQVNTDPKMSLSVHLHVADSANTDAASVALIKGPAEVHVREGSPVSFTCEVIPSSGQVEAAKPRIKWFHDGIDVAFQGDSGVSIDIDYRNKNVQSTINISRASHRDQGVYTCYSDRSQSSLVRLYVGTGEFVEAMQRDAAAYSSGEKNFFNDPHVSYFTCMWILFNLII